MNLCSPFKYIAILMLGSMVSAAQVLPATVQPGPSTPQTITSPSAAFEIHGQVKSGNIPLPGVTVSAANSLTGKKVVTSTEVDGRYKLVLPSKGKYVVRAELSAFAAATAEVVVNPATPAQNADIELILLSRVPKPTAAEANAANPQQTVGAAGGRGGMQRLSVSPDENGAANGSEGGEAPLAGMPALAQSADAANQSVAYSGQTGTTQDLGVRNMDDLRDRIQEMRDRGELPSGNTTLGGGGGIGGPGGGGGFGGPGGGGGGYGGPGMMRGGGRGRMNFNQPHGSLYYTAGNALFDASPYSLSGAPADKPDYGSSRFGATVGGPLNIPHIYQGGTKTFFFVNYTGTRSTTPYQVFSHVPTEEERAGNFSNTVYTSGPNARQPVTLFDPQHPGVSLGNTIPSNLMNPAALGLLPFIPLPNQPGQQNFRFSSSADSDNDNLSLRLIHNFGAGGFTPGGGGGRAARSSRPRNNLNIAVNYTRGNSDQLQPFPSVAGKNQNNGLNFTVGHNFSRGKFNNNFRVNYNILRSDISNLYAGINNIAGDVGVQGVSQSPSDFGLPSLSFSNFAGLRDVAPQQRKDRTLSFSESAGILRGKHNVRVGGDFRRLWTDLHLNTNPRGTFVFTGFATANQVGGQPLAGTGYDFADFLLGIAQQTSIQFSPTVYNFNANAWDAFVSDDWRMRGNLTIQLGLRYEYNSPYTEAQNRLVNLDVAPTFTAADAVLPNANGTFDGHYPASLVRPDRNNFAPRVGIAWRAMDKTVIRAGYGINYNIGQYRNIIQNLAFQPPFSFTETNISSASQLLTLQNGFPAVTNTLTNNYAVDPNYRLGYVQMWNANIQRELPKNILLNIGYTGSKGTALDIVRAPNRGPDGTLRISGIQPFLFESSQGSSILHAGSVRLRKRMTQGFSLGATYVYSKSIDNASSIGGGASVVAQNDLDLSAERGLSSFDQRHRFTGDFLYELPLGSGKRWLTGENFASRVLGDWTWSGSFTLASGTPFTPRVIGAFTDVSSGVNGTLRADVTGQPIGGGGSVLQWFNTAAFTVPPSGNFGDAGRNSIIGPGTVLFNMSMSKTIPMRDMMGLEIRADANNIFNHANFTSIDSVVNSPTFGQVISVGTMRTMTLTTRFRF